MSRKQQKAVKWEQLPDSWQRQREESIPEVKRERLKPLTRNQAVYFKAIESSTITLCTGPAGTGKTFIACGIAAQMLNDGHIDGLVITRPLVSCGQGYGFRKGTVFEKVSPVMRPMLDALEEFFGKKKLNVFVEDGTVELWPLDDMRGASIKRKVIICDESQNAEQGQLRMLLTRFGKDTKVIVTGDATQSDLPNRGVNPFMDVIERFRPSCHADVSIVELTTEDIVRHGLIRWVEERLSTN